jgi:hypothetical protein
MPSVLEASEMMIRALIPRRSTSSPGLRPPSPPFGMEERDGERRRSGSWRANNQTKQRRGAENAKIAEGVTQYAARITGASDRHHSLRSSAFSVALRFSE